MTKPIDMGDLRLPLGGASDYSDEFIDKRINFIETLLNVNISSLQNLPKPYLQHKGNAENLLGAINIPLGIIGPLLVNGNVAKGGFFVPLATTEGVLISSFHRGSRIISKSGGAIVRSSPQRIHVTPVLVLADIGKICDFEKWIKDNFLKIKELAESTTKHGKLVDYRLKSFGRKIYLTLIYDSGDAMGMNMITIASDLVLKYIIKFFDVDLAYPRSNYSSDKKQSAHLYMTDYGRRVTASAIISEELLRYLGSTVQDVMNFYKVQLEAGVLAGMYGINGQFANGIAALFAATGQDIAQVVNSASGITDCSVDKLGRLIISVELKNLLVGTVGGGTKQPYASTCLEILNCKGSGKSEKFAEITAATVLAGELSILGALSSGTFVKAHQLFGR